VSDTSSTSARALRFALAIAGLAILAGAAFGVWRALPERAPAGASAPAPERLAAQSSPALPEWSRAGQALPEIRFLDGEGRSRSLADFRGKVVLLNLWATWCAPCREEMPSLDRLQQALGPDGFEVLALSLDAGGAEAVRRFYAETGVRSLAVYVDPTMKATTALRALGVPTTILVDRDGAERWRKTGPAHWDAPEFVAAFREAIAAQAAAGGRR
jgi:thiol-disulfide isomerase/thioredoxin